MTRWIIPTLLMTILLLTLIVLLAMIPQVGWPLLAGLTLPGVATGLWAGVRGYWRAWRANHEAHTI